MPWQMLLPYVDVVDGKPQRQMLTPLLHQDGKCYYHSFVMWQMISHTACMLQHLKMADGRFLMAPKDKDPILKKSGVIYRYKCDRVECDEEYIGESSRTFGERFKEHQKDPSPIYDHYNITGHKISIDNFSVEGREDQSLMRTIKEALYIAVNNPSLNRNKGQYHLPHIWDEVLLNTSKVKINKFTLWLFHLPPVAFPSATLVITIYHLSVTHPAVAIPSATWQ